MDKRIRFDGRTAIVTGAGRGLGREFALLLGRRGANVIVHDIEHAQVVAEEINAAGGHAIPIESDIADAASASEAVRCAIAEFGSVDIVINNAGLLILKNFAESTEDDLIRTLDVNVRGSWLLAHAAWPHMCAQQHGRILMVSSMNGIAFGTNQHAAYGASKGALVGLTREIAFEGRGFGINVNALLPGAMTTMLQMLTAYDSPDIDLNPALVAPVAAWLVHEQCETTGALINASSARVGRLITCLGPGFQSTPDAFTLEDVRAKWAQALDADNPTRIDTISDYNNFRTERYLNAKR